MLTRIAIATVAALIVAMGTITLWGSLRQDNIDQVARIAEAESWAARSQLVRRMDMMLTALRNVGAFWSAFGHLPRDQWSADAGIELEHFAGIELLLWDDPPLDVRYARTPEHSSFNYRPADEEWAEFQALAARAGAVKANTINGPLIRDDGSPYFEIYYVNVRRGQSGTLAAVVDAHAVLEGMLSEDSPGYAIRVYSDDILLYERGTPDEQAPESWVREGKIQTSLGSVWRVVHLPTIELSESFSGPTIDMILLLGLLIAGLVGTLIFENSRARSRARAAEAAERSLAKLNRELEQKVADRTADLRTLTDSVAHDLRNPLNVISINVQLLHDQFSDDLSEQATETLKRLSPSLDQMAEILDRLLGLSVASNSTFERESIDMRELVNHVVDDLLVAEPEPLPDVHIGDLPGMEADRKLVQMLLINLLSNAMKYTRGVAERSVSVDYVQTNGEQAFCVQDNGIGFDNNARDRLFVAFDRLDAATAADGVGLGLTIAARVVERHGGKIWAEGRPGEGAAFYFTLGCIPLPRTTNQDPRQAPA